MDDQKQQLIDKLKSANNILVTVSANPSVDQLSACIGLTIALNKLDKHATAVFSGDIPETIEFLRPEETLEKNTDSLRDFIIALDKAKADKLRYKVEDKVVKIFITPYRTSISEDDLDFSQGDFNVDVVVALGVQNQQDLDQAITAHGRILHDATVVGINNEAGGELATINWIDQQASSLSELVAKLTKQLDKKLTDEQIATAYLTGIVAATDRFRNEKTSADTMSVSADLMAAGANQQLVTSELEHAVDLRSRPEVEHSSERNVPNQPAKARAEKNDGTLEIDHGAPQPEEPKTEETTAAAPQSPEDTAQLPAITNVHSHPDEGKEPEAYHEPGYGRDVMTEPPTFGGALTANDKQVTETFQPSADFADGDQSSHLLTHAASENEQSAKVETQEPVSLPSPDPLPGTLELDMSKDVPPAPAQPSEPLPAFAAPAQPLPPTPPAEVQPSESSNDLSAFASTPPESAAPSPTVTPDTAIGIDAAREEVMRALSEQPDDTLPPIAALNAQPMGGSLHAAPMPPAAPQPQTPPAPASMPQPLPTQPDLPPAPQSPADQPLDMPLPPGNGGLNVPPPQSMPPTNGPNAQSPNTPPPVPPPMMPPSWPGSTNQ